MGYIVGDKFVVEIKEVFMSQDNADKLYRLNDFKSLVFDENGLDKLERLDSDYVNEHFGELQDEAYKAGEKAGTETALKWSQDNEGDMYNQGLNDAWELARKIVLDVSKGGIPERDMRSMFGEKWTVSDILKNYTPQEALAKLEAYEKEQAKINVGDEVTVFPKSGGQYNAIVVYVRGFDFIDVIYKDGVGAYNVSPELYKKTGKHIDIQSVLQQIGGAE